jgi:hypothetical protein
LIDRPALCELVLMSSPLAASGGGHALAVGEPEAASRARRDALDEDHLDPGRQRCGVRLDVREAIEPDVPVLVNLARISPYYAISFIARASPV